MKNRSDLVKKISSKTQIHSEDAHRVVDSIINFISDSLARTDRVEVRNFGTFSIRKRDKRVSRNPKTGTSVLVEATNHPYFRASKYLKESLNK
jgi:integration host factor subunit beta